MRYFRDLLILGLTIGISLSVPVMLHAGIQNYVWKHNKDYLEKEFVRHNIESRKHWRLLDKSAKELSKAKDELHTTINTVDKMLWSHRSVIILYEEMIQDMKEKKDD